MLVILSLCCCLIVGCLVTDLLPMLSWCFVACCCLCWCFDVGCLLACCLLATCYLLVTYLLLACCLLAFCLLLLACCLLIACLCLFIVLKVRSPPQGFQAFVQRTRRVREGSAVRLRRGRGRHQMYALLTRRMYALYYALFSLCSSMSKRPGLLIRVIDVHRCVCWSLLQVPSSVLSTPYTLPTMIIWQVEWS